MIGQRFDRWTIIEEAERYVAPNGRKNRQWLCRCDCGTEKVIPQMRLRSGNSKSCGCFKSDNLKEIKRKHGHYVGRRSSPTRNSWRSMIARCCNEQHEQYKDYGARGITVCERWHTFENFLADMGERPKGKTLDRIENDKGYEPGNCCWSTRVEQMRNTRHNRKELYKGKDRAISEISEMCGVSDSLIRSRLDRGWSIDKAVVAKNFHTGGHLAVG